MPSPDASTFDTIALLPATERLGSGYRVFGDDLLFGFSTDRVYAGDTGSDEILVLAYDGDTLTSFPAPFERKRVPEELKVEGVIEVALPDGGTRFVPGYKNYPETFPRYGRLQVDAEGYLWVMEYPVEREPFHSWRLALPQGNLVPDGGARWRVLDEEGLVVQEVRTPPGLFVTEIGRDYVLGISRDDLDVETVHLYDLRR